jgi:peptidyl-prolyl cis-trans isomerase C
MYSIFRLGLGVAGLLLTGATALAQQTVPPPTPPPSTPASNATDVAATVNGQPILEIDVERGLRRLPAPRQAEVRPLILKVLIDNAVIEQYLQRSVTVDPKVVDAKLQEIRTAIQKQGSTFEKEIQAMMLTEADLRARITEDVRFNTFVDQKATDAVLQDVFRQNKEVFDGTLVRARHILLTPASGDAQAGEAARTKLQGFKKQIEDDVSARLAKLPAGTTDLAREEARCKLTDAAFSRIARTESACPSRQADGDLGYFPRSGKGGMVEPFARTAFALRPYQVSDVVPTEFGYHLILVIDRKPGKEVKLEEVKESVRNLYADQLRDAMAAQLRPQATIKINK